MENLNIDIEKIKLNKNDRSNIIMTADEKGGH